MAPLRKLPFAALERYARFGVACLLVALGVCATSYAGEVDDSATAATGASSDAVLDGNASGSFFKQLESLGNVMDEAVTVTTVQTGGDGTSSGSTASTSSERNATGPGREGEKGEKGEKGASAAGGASGGFLPVKQKSERVGEYASEKEVQSGAPADDFYATTPKASAYRASTADLNMVGLGGFAQPLNVLGALGDRKQTAIDRVTTTFAGLTAQAALRNNPQPAAEAKEPRPEPKKKDVSSASPTNSDGTKFGDSRDFNVQQVASNAFNAQNKKDRDGAGKDKDKDNDKDKKDKDKDKDKKDKEDQKKREEAEQFLKTLHDPIEFPEYKELAKRFNEDGEQLGKVLSENPNFQKIKETILDRHVPADAEPVSTRQKLVDFLTDVSKNQNGDQINIAAEAGEPHVGRPGTTTPPTSLGTSGDVHQ